jgi:hypothetical protein
LVALVALLLADVELDEEDPLALVADDAAAVSELDAAVALVAAAFL